MTKWFECACGKLLPEFSGTLEVHKKFCGKLRLQKKRITMKPWDLVFYKGSERVRVLRRAPPSKSGEAMVMVERDGGKTVRVATKFLSPVTRLLGISARVRGMTWEKLWNQKS